MEATPPLLFFYPVSLAPSPLLCHISPSPCLDSPTLATLLPPLSLLKSCLPLQASLFPLKEIRTVTSYVAVSWPTRFHYAHRLHPISPTVTLPPKPLGITPRSRHQLVRNAKKLRGRPLNYNMFLSSKNAVHIFLVSPATRSPSTNSFPSTSHHFTFPSHYSNYQHPDNIHCPPCQRGQRASAHATY